MQVLVHRSLTMVGIRYNVLRFFQKSFINVSFLLIIIDFIYLLYSKDVTSVGGGAPPGGGGLPLFPVPG